MGGFGGVEVYELARRYTKKLIGAVVECALDNAPSPIELRLAWQCERWNTLPDDGGLYKQDYQTLLRMSFTQNVYNAIVRVKALTGENIHQLTDNERKILKMLMDNGFMFNA